MVVFDSTHKTDFENFLYNSCIHDAFLTDIKIFTPSRISVTAVNHTYNQQYHFVFDNVHWCSYSQGDWHGENEQVLSLSLEESIPCQPQISDGIILLFQMFSGSEIYIVCDTVNVEQTVVIA